MRFKGLAIGILIIGFACSRFGSQKLIPENKLVNILTDIHLADAISFTSKFRAQFRNNDSITYYDRIFSKYSVTRTQFDSTISWYAGNPDKYNIVYDKVLEHLNRMAADINEKLRADSTLSQLGNLWNKKRDWILPKDGATENIPFTIKVEKLGEYKLSASIKINATDQSNHPFLMAYIPGKKSHKSTAKDTASIVNLEKTSVFKLYSVSVFVTKDTATLIKGFILGNDPKPGSWVKSAEVHDIRLIHVTHSDIESIQ